MTTRFSLVTASLVALACAGSCGSAPIAQPPPPPEVAAADWRCDGNNPRDSVIPVVLAKDGQGACHARVVPPSGAAGNPRVCTGNRAIWRVTNNCDAEIEVSFVFNPFTKDSEGKVRAAATREIRSPVVRPKARETAGNYPPYKYDILLNGEIDVDPELEIEKRRR
jgi:hypothetical protein